jgi:hypothetical protein
LTIALQAAPTPTPGPKHTSNKNQKMAPAPQETLAQSANGWVFVKNEWVHPEGYKFVNGKVLRTTARPGKAFPNPPGKLALENAQKLTSKTAPVQKSAAETAAEVRRKNLEPRPAPQTGTHL